MNYSYTREPKGNDFVTSWSHCNYELLKTLEKAWKGAFSEAEYAEYLQKAINDAEPVPGLPDRVSWGYSDPNTMPSDARCEFFYYPTYLMMATAFTGINQYPRLMERAEIRDVLRKGLITCTGRGLSGHGYDSTAELLANLTMFLKSGIRYFIRDYPEVCPEFNEMIEEIIAGLQKDLKENHTVLGWNVDYAKEMSKVLDLYGESKYALHIKVAESI